MRIGGKANMVKKAVAPAIFKGSFSRKSFKASFKTVPIDLSELPIKSV